MRNIIKRGMQMRDVKVKTSVLLEKVLVNREKHIAEYEDSVIGYKEAAVAAIEKGMTNLKRQVEELESGETMHLGAVTFNLQVPENHEKDYDQVIAMLEMSVEDEITIKSDEFACYVMDDWDWKDQFKNVSAMYMKGR